MTEVNVAKLRSLAEQARNRPDSVEWQRFWDELTEGHILALLDHLEQAEADAAHQAKRADANLNDMDAAIERAERAEAVIERVRALLREPTFAEKLSRDFGGNVWPLTVKMDDLRAALDTGKEKND